MEEDSSNSSRGPTIDDSALDRHLGSLTAFDPYPGFEDRVMSRVFVPPPIWMQRATAAVRSFLDTRRARRLGAGLLATSTVTLIVATTLALSNFSTVSRVFNSAAANIGLPLWHSFLGVVSESAPGVYVFVAPLFASRETFLIASVAAVGFLVVDALLLVCLMRPGCFARSE